jgi:hypothetical protein
VVKRDKISILYNVDMKNFLEISMKIDIIHILKFVKFIDDKIHVSSTPFYLLLTQ